MTDIKIFESQEFGQVRTVDVDGEPWLVGKDVAEALGYENPARAIRSHVDEDDKGETEMVTPGGRQTAIIINESGLYSLVLSSKLPTAKKFKRWITSEVLPSIRKHGLYATAETVDKMLADPDTAITHADGHVTVNKTVKVTGKGQQYFIAKFLGGAS